MIAAPYLHPNAKVDSADQIIIRYRPSDSTFVEYVTKSKKHIYITTEYEETLIGEDLLFLRDLKEKSNNWTLRVRVDQVTSAANPMDMYKALVDCCPHLMFSDIFSQWETIDTVINEYPEVSEVIVGFGLGFQLTGVVAYCHRKDVKVRVIANVAQWAQDSFINLNTSDIRGFFIRPEDAELYQDIVDAIELSDMPYYFNSKKYINVALAAYQRGTWAGNLQELIIGLNEEVYNPYLPFNFGVWRTTCRHGCTSGKKCNLCRVLMQTQEIIDKVAEATE